jgi:two-component system, cell cycle sensor histidine kinase and response regulator CckA
VSFSVTEIFTFSAVLLCGPGAGTLAVALDALVISLRLASRGLPARRLMLNITAPPLAMWVAAHALYALADVRSLAEQPLEFAALILALSASAGIYYLLNTWMIAKAIAIEQRASVGTVWREHFLHLWVSFFAGAYAAGVIVVSLGSLGLPFMAIVVPLPLLVYYAMQTWLGRLRDRVRYLEEANEQARNLQHQQALRLQTETALRERDSQLRAVFDHALDALLLVDDDRRVVDVNPAASALLEVSRDALPDSALDGFLDAASATSLSADWPALLEDGERHGNLVIAGRSGPRTIEFSFKASVVPGRHLFIWRDVSERKRLEGQLLQSQKMETVGRLAGGVAHDFNNLLTVILGYGNLVLEEVDGPLRDDVREIVRAAERAAGLTRQLLAFSRKQILKPDVVNVNGIVGNVEKMLRHLVDERIEITTTGESALWSVKVDPAQLEQVIVNLVVNARDAIHENGRITIETANVTLGSMPCFPEAGGVAPGPYVRLSVTDSGCGMDVETREHIFEPFFTTKATEKGTGLGLSTVYGIVRQSGGHISVESAPGAGTTFHIHLPRAEGSTKAASAEDAETRLPSRGNETVLLVEDEPALRSLAAHALSRQGYEVLEAACGVDALAVAEEHGFRCDALVTDMIMPGMTGKELAARLLIRVPGLKVVLMSGYAGESVGPAAALPGSVFVQKPFTPRGLAKTVRDLLDGAPAGGSPGGPLTTPSADQPDSYAIH